VAPVHLTSATGLSGLEFYHKLQEAKEGSQFKTAL